MLAVTKSTAQDGQRVIVAVQAGDGFAGITWDCAEPQPPSA